MQANLVEEIEMDLFNLFLSANPAAGMELSSRVPEQPRVVVWACQFFVCGVGFMGPSGASSRSCSMGQGVANPWTLSRHDATYSILDFVKVITVASVSFQFVRPRVCRPQIEVPASPCAFYWRCRRTVAMFLVLEPESVFYIARVRMHCCFLIYTFLISSLLFHMKDDRIGFRWFFRHA